MDLRDLADDLITSEGRGNTPFGTYVLPGLDPSAELGRSVEREVFGEFFGNSPELLAAEYGPYEANSVFFVVLDHRMRTPAGVMRILLPHGPAKSLDDISRAWGEPASDVIARTCPEMDLTSLWDIATLAAMPDYRGSSSSGLISLALYQALGMLGTRSDAKWAVAVLDVIVLDMLQKMSGRPFKYFKGLEPRRYLDSPSSLPVYMDRDEHVARLEFTEPTIYEITIKGTGLEAAVSAPDWDQTAADGLLRPRRSAPRTGAETVPEQTGHLRSVS
jgi:hypothetical protein